MPVFCDVFAGLGALIVQLAVSHPGPLQSVVEVPPEAGTLVLMDAVAVPHEVLPTLAGERLALAGWLHEESQEPPEWFGEEA